MRQTVIPLHKRPIPVPDGRSYLPYQESGIRYALGAPLGTGTILADEMGLGKTVQAIGFINAIPGWPTVVVICPAGLKTNWHAELAAWLFNKKLTVNVISYHEAEKYAARAKADCEEAKWDILIVDEAQYIKNPESKRSQAVTIIAREAERVLLLTGTPMENRPIELWPLLRIAAPAQWDPSHTRLGVISADKKASHPGEGPNFWAFAKRYCGLKKSFFPGRGGRRMAWDFSGASNLDELSAKLKATCMVRRLKETVLTQLPDKRFQLVLLDSIAEKIDDSDMLPELSEHNYSEQVRSLIADKVKFAEYSKRRHEQALKKVDPTLVFLRDQMDGSQKIIVFAHHRDVIAKLEMGITAELDAGDYMVCVTGETHVADRGANVKAFQEDPKCRIFLGSIGAAGLGITLTASSHVIFVELDPVPGKMAQAMDRAHRIGQKGSVLVQYLMFNNSLCARLAQIVVKKQGIINRVLDVK